MKLMNNVIKKYQNQLVNNKEKMQYWYKRGVNQSTLIAMNIGWHEVRKCYVFPYFDLDGNCYFYNSVDENKKYRWFPQGLDEAIRIFNIQDIKIASRETKTLHICEGEKDLLIIKMLGYLAVAVPGANSFKKEYVEYFRGVKDIVICFDHDKSGEEGGAKVAHMLGSNARLMKWPQAYLDKFDINDLYLGDKEEFNRIFQLLVKDAESITQPVLSPSFNKLVDLWTVCANHSKNEIIGIPTGFKTLDKYTGGLSGIIILGGAPKSGKTTFALNIAMHAANNSFPIVYLDFENGEINLLLKILSGLVQTPIKDIFSDYHNFKESSAYRKAEEEFFEISRHLFIIRPSLKDLPEKNIEVEYSEAILEKYVVFIKEQLKYEKNILIIVDSLQKLPAWNSGDRRWTVDSWLRSFECIKNKFNVTFLVISELSRGKYDAPSVESFKESGDIEYTADLALIIRNSEDFSELHAVANRNGPINKIATYAPTFKHSIFKEVSSFSIDRSK